MRTLARERHTQLAFQLMLDFAQRTGLSSERRPQRYLWTDAFAVCNVLGLARQTGESCYVDLARAWIDKVQHVLGRYREDDVRTGWISGLSEREGEAHPTRGGLRIGKLLPERGPGEAFDERLEWERDGQYFHYLTRWMHALDQAARATGDARLNVWARELAETAQRAFTRATRGTDPRMVWKMSTDLSRPLVSSMGHHDPLDGWITCAELCATARQLGALRQGPDLARALAAFSAMVEGGEWVTADALGLGGLLADARRLSWLLKSGELDDAALLDAVLVAAAAGLAQYARLGELERPASQRLAFRELGLAIGLSALPLIARDAPRAPVGVLERYAKLGAQIESFWLEPENRRTRAWLEHRDINDVMLATRLVPDGYLSMDTLDAAA
jgi:hypothetical protein